jgi:hypothetical protein
LLLSPVVAQDDVQRPGTDDPTISSPTSQPWYVDLDEATKMARSSGKPMMVVFR